jgi:hypothetical protein
MFVDVMRFVERSMYVGIVLLRRNGLFFFTFNGVIFLFTGDTTGGALPVASGEAIGQKICSMCF